MNLVITGLGAVTPVGISLDETWSALLNGKSGVDRIGHFDPKGFRVQIDAEVRGWDPQTLVKLPAVRPNDIKFWLSRASQFSLKAANEAALQAQLDTSQYADQGGVWVGNGGGGISGYFDVTKLILEGNENKVGAEFIIRALQNMIGAWVTRYLGMRGPTQTVQTACASSFDATATAAAFISSPWFPQIRYAIVVGAEAALDQNNCAAFAGAKALSTRNNDPAKASRPFDLDRDGFVQSEGAGAIVIEEENFAKERGAKPLARIRSIAVGSEGGGSERSPVWLTEPNVEACSALACQGLALAGWSPKSVDLWVAHGTSTKKNDVAETEVIKKVFGEHASEMLVPSIKSMLGHGLGAAGIWNVITGVMSILSGQVPPTVNLEHPDPQCDLNYVPNKAVQAKVDRFIAAALGFGDQNGYVFAERFTGWEV